MDTNLSTTGCAECAADNCGECRRPRGFRPDASGVYHPTCCCGSSDTLRNDPDGNQVVTEHGTLRLPDLGSADDVLRAHGWRRVSAWMRRDDMPTGHRLAMVEPGPASASIEQLDRDQQIGDQRRPERS